MRHSALFICLAVASALLAACSDDESPVRAEASTTTTVHAVPMLGDHWHVAIGFSRCGTWLDPPEDAGNDEQGIHSHDDGLIHVHPFFERVTGDNATLKWFLEDIGATVGDDSLELASGEVLPFTGDCDGEAATLRVARWRSADDGLPVMAVVEDADDLLDQPLRPDGAVIGIVFTADEQIDQPPSVAALATPSDSASTRVDG